MEVFSECLADRKLVYHLRFLATAEIAHIYITFSCLKLLSTIAYNLSQSWPPLPQKHTPKLIDIIHNLRERQKKRIYRPLDLLQLYDLTWYKS